MLRDKDIIWQCVSCNKCTYACPRDVNPEGVMKATAHWLELKGHTEQKPSTVFDEVFSEQVFATGKIEEGRVIREFFERTGQPLFQDWLIALVRGLVCRLPVGLLAKLGLANLVSPAHTRLGPSARPGDRANMSPNARPRSRKALGLGIRRSTSDERKTIGRSLIIPAARLKAPATRTTDRPRSSARRSASISSSSDNWNCCGAMEVKNVDPKLQTYLSARNLSIAESMGFDTVMAPCNGCYHNLKKAEYDLAQRFRFARGHRSAVEQSRPQVLPGGYSQHHPCARLDQGGYWRGRI